MRQHDHPLMSPEGTVGGQRFLPEDIQDRAADLAGIQGGQQVFLDHLLAAPRGDEGSTLRQAREQLCVDHVLGLRRQGQEAHQDVRASEKLGQLLLPGVGGDALDLLAAAAPAGNREAERCQLACGVAAQMPQAQDADAPVSRGPLADLLPMAGQLLVAVVDHGTVDHQAGHDHELRHAGGQAGLDHADHRHVAGQLRVGQEMVDARADGEDALEVGQAGEKARGWLPDNGELYLRFVAHLGPEPQFLIGDLLVEGSGPSAAAVDVRLEEQGHVLRLPFRFAF